MDKKTVLYKTANGANTEKINTKRIGSIRDENGQKWYLFLARGKDGKYHELLRSVYLHSIFDVCLNQSAIAVVPKKSRKMIINILSPKTFQAIFCDENLDALDQIEAEEKILSAFFVES